MSDATTSGCREISMHSGEPVEYSLKSWSCASLAEFPHNLVKVIAANVACFHVQSPERRGNRLEKEQNFLNGFPVVALRQQLLGASER